jgi:hypothetical protein
MFDEDDQEYDDDNERESEEYECQNKGCSNPEGTTFEAAPSAWFENKGLSTPTNCPVCKDWIREQKEDGAITATCVFCGYTWPVAAEFRISYHKYQGNWDEYWSKDENQLCLKCLEFPNRRLKLKVRRAEKAYRDADWYGNTYKEKSLEDIRGKDSQRREDNSLVLTLGSDPFRFDVPSEAGFYFGIETPKDKVNKHGETQLDHIMKSDHKWSELGDMGDPNAILYTASHIARAQSDFIRQFDAGGGVIAKFDTNQMIVVLIVEDDRSTSGYRIETAFPSDGKYVMNKVNDGVWTW